MVKKNVTKILICAVLSGSILGNVAFAAQLISSNSKTQQCYKENSDGKKKTINIDADLIASIPEEKIYLYGLNKDKSDNNYKDLVLSINGINKVFNWQSGSLIEEQYLPHLYLSDLNNDGKKELVLILNEASGTGVSINTVHIMNPENFTEYKVEDPLDIINKNISTKISSKEIEILKNGTIEKSFKMPSYYNISKVFFKDHIDYAILENNKLQAEVGIEFNQRGYLGSIIIEYSFNDGVFKADKISITE
jgi:hypothetical protein